MTNVDVSRLDKRFADLADEYPRRKAAAESAVVRWEWYTDSAFDLRPVWYERHRWVPGRRIAERPALDRNHSHVGFDADGRPVAAHEFSGFLGGTCIYETYRLYVSADIVEQAHFEAGGRPIYLHEYRFSCGVIGSAITVATGGAGREDYTILTDDAGQQVTSIEALHATRTHGALSELAPYQSIHATHDAAGLASLTVFWRTGSGVEVEGVEVEVVYRRPPADFSVDEACATVAEALVAAIPAAVAAAGPVDYGPAYCVALVYSGDDPVESTVVVGLAARREQWLADPAARDFIWNPAELDDDMCVEPSLVPVRETARLLAQELYLAGAEDRGRAMLCDVAQRLNRFDWAGTLPTTDDFVVYAVDDELVDLERNMAACAPPERVALLRARGLL